MTISAISALLVMACFCLVGALRGGKPQNEGEYALSGRKAGALSVAGVISGAMIAGGSTIGTVQMAYDTGMSALWFTLGSGISCVLLGLRLVRPLRASRMSTITEMLESEYGRATAALAMIGSTSGTILSVAAQFVAGTALLRSVLPVSAPVSAILLAVVILAFIFTGGLRSLAAVGVAKLAALVFVLLLCCSRAAATGQTPSAIAGVLPLSPWFNPVSRGIAKDLGPCVALIFGMFGTQIYIQAILSGRDESSSRMGALISGISAPIFGLMGIWIGLAMRASGVEVEAATALPRFISANFSPALAGVLWGILAITLIGSASGLCLGVATTISHDIFARMPAPAKADAPEAALRFLLISQVSVVMVVVVSAVLGAALGDRQILGVTFAAVGLRGTGAALPLLVALTRPRLLTPGYAAASVLLGLTGTVAAALFSGFEPLFAGLASASVPILLRLAKRNWGYIE